LKYLLPALCLFAVAGSTAIHAQDGVAPQPQPKLEDSAVPSEAAPAKPDEAAELADPGVWPDWKTREIVLLKKIFGLPAVFATAPAALADQFRKFPKEWGQNWNGFGKRAASEYGQYVVYAGIESVVQALHKEDPRYFRSGQGNFFQRTGHVIARTFVARKQGGGNTFALSLPAAAYGSWAIASRWNPRSLRTPMSVFEWGSSGVEMKASANFFREFWPDVKSLFRKK
jgi:hypothetical protein